MLNCFRRNLTVKNYSVALLALACMTALLMYLVMDTAGDRSAYLAIFSNPFSNGRIEPGFKYYAVVLNSLGVPPGSAVILSCVLIYALLARFWFAAVRVAWAESILVFNFFAYSLFQYYLGASLRMGLSTAIALYAFARLLQGNRKFALVLVCAPLIHYGTIPFALAALWVNFTRRVSWKLHAVLIALLSIGSVAIIRLILESNVLGPYYALYFHSDMGQGHRIFPLVGIFYLLAISMVVVRNANRVVKRLALYGMPLFTIGALQLAGYPLFFKMLMPFAFLSAAVLFSDYARWCQRNMTSPVRAYGLLCCNVLAVAFALKHYNFL